ncbi:MAG: XTP/dITP diphosphatase, partial [Hadesarchaea archaeon]|nr:XTP/dITP diphosphatase [Hadesarchaea archaeon]
QKFEEAREIASSYGIKLKMHRAPREEIQSDKLEEIAMRSVISACLALKKPCFVEDAGLFVKALNGFPGPYSSYAFKTIGNKGLLKLMAGEDDRRAEFRSVVAYCEPNSKPVVFSGNVRGCIALTTHGSGGFGFDPIFIPIGGNGRTFAEMSIDEKNKFSHRAKAIEKFLKWYIQRKKA